MSNASSNRVWSSGALRREADVGSDVEEDRQVRQETARGDRLELAQVGNRDTGAMALVGDGRVRIPSAHDRRPTSQRGSDDLLDQLMARGVEEKCIGQGINSGG